MLSRMKIGQDSDSDSDLEDPDVEELELLRRALGTRYTAVSPFGALNMPRRSSKSHHSMNFRDICMIK